MLIQTVLNKIENFKYFIFGDAASSPNAKMSKPTRITHTTLPFIQNAQ